MTIIRAKSLEAATKFARTNSGRLDAPVVSEATDDDIQWARHRDCRIYETLEVTQ